MHRCPGTGWVLVVCSIGVSMYLQLAEKTSWEYLHLELLLLLCGWSTALWLSLQWCFVSSNLKAFASFSVNAVEKV